MERIEACKNIEELERLVLSDSWRGNPALVIRIVDRLMELQIRGSTASFANFGNIDFWDTFYEYRENGQVEPAVEDDDFDMQAPATIYQWQRAVERGEWENQPEAICRLFDQYLGLIPGHQHEGEFGTRQFWDAFGHLINFRNGEWILATEYNQRGCGIPVAADAEELLPSHYYILEPQFTKTSKRFATGYGQYNFRFQNMENVADLESILLGVFEAALQTLRGDGSDDDMVSFLMTHPLLDQPIVVPLRPQKDMTAEAIVEAICKVLQSKTELTLDDENMVIYFTRVQKPSGSGRTSCLKRKYNTNMGEYLKKKRAIIEIKNNDALCCARAIVTAKARLDNDPQYNTIRDGDHSRKTLQRRLAEQLMVQAGLALHIGPCGHEEWLALQKAIGEGHYQIKIFDKDMFNGLIYAGPEAPKILYLWLHDNHFDVITRITAFFENSYYCDNCNKAYDHRTEHRRCPVHCSWCMEPGQCLRDVAQPLIKCEACLRFFNNHSCYHNHLNSKGEGQHQTISICKQLKRCGDCGREFQVKAGHQCGEKHCPVCKEDYTGDGHECYIQPFEPKGKLCDDLNDDNDHNSETDVAGGSAESGPSTKKKKVEKRSTFIYYDMECTQDQAVGQNDHGDINLHQPDLIIAHKVCDGCCDQTTLGPCDYCWESHRVFLGDSCLASFCEWLFTKQNDGAIAIAHNAKGYDCQFILDYCHRNGLKPKHIICRGLEILYMEVGGVQFKDSLNFLPMALAALPKAFDVTECKKGYFPHLFNRRENWDYDGDWPSVEYYQPERMKSGDREKFLAWYEEQKGKRFNLQRELIEYCESDVEVLRKCCLKFRKLFMEIGQLDPFVCSITIASACNKFYRMHHLPENKIAIIPHGGYRKEEKQSLLALRWLKWMAESTGRQIRHKLNGGEVRIGPYRVDGLADKTIYELYGCAWHGCLSCFPRRQQLTPGGNLTMAEAYQRTMDRRQYLEQQGYTLVEKWECDLRGELKKDKTMAAFFKSVALVDPLDAREAFYGGRTNATVLYHKAAAGEKMRYIDVLSLYPYICKYGRFPTGHPQIITENFEKMDASSMPYEGLIKCRVLPPRKLLHPVLPYRSQGKLTFPLCAACVDARNKEACHHFNDERALSGAWVSLELKKALELGYDILEVYEVWHFKEYEQYDTIENPNGGLFTAYINEFLRIKQEADGWPSGVTTEEAETAFIEQWKTREGLELRHEKMIKNAGLRALAKLMLNSFWGKFGQRSRMPRTEYFTEPAAYFALVFDPQLVVKNVRIVNENLVAVTYEQTDEFVDVLANTNPVVAAYTTAQARLKLYSYIEMLQDRVLYFDTDSIIYIDRPSDEYHPSLGNFLGEMTDELEKEGPDSFITEFVSGGPKHYGYKVWSGKEKKETIAMKVKGFRIDHETSAIVNFENLRKKVQLYVKNGCRAETEVLIPRIERGKDQSVTTLYRKKVYRITYDKRILLPDFTTLPYGYLRA